MKNIYRSVRKILDLKERRKFISLTVLDLLVSVLDIAFIGAMLLVINFYTRGAASGAGKMLGRFFDHNSMLLISGFFLLFSTKNLLAYYVAKSQNFFFYQIASRLSARNVREYLRAGYMEFVNVNSSVQIRKISHQPIEFSNYILTNIQQIISQSALIFFTVVAILFYHPSLFLLLFVLLLPPVILLAWFIKSKLKAIRLSTKIISIKVIQHLQEALTGFTESNIYDRSDFFADRYLTYQRKLNSNIATQQSLQGLPSRLIEVFAILGFLILVGINKWSATAPGMDLLNIGIFIAASYKIIPGIVKILNSAGQIKAYQFTLTDLAPGVAQGSVAINSSTPITSIEFKKIDFSINGTDVISGLDFKINASDFAGISGKSGLGKTTLINLLLGFLEPQQGDILINGVATSQSERQGYWPRISYVKQQTFLINESILKNITLIDDEHNQTRLDWAVAICGVNDMVIDHPEGLNKQITENGKNISGGQRQRIVLACALYHDFDLLILDEPFNEMDTEAEHEILGELKKLTEQGKMVLFVTHNTVSLNFCNKTILPHAN